MVLPFMLSLSTTAVPEGPGGRALSIWLRYHAQGHDKKDTVYEERD